MNLFCLSKIVKKVCEIWYMSEYKFYECLPVCVWVGEDECHSLNGTNDLSFWFYTENNWKKYYKKITNATIVKKEAIKNFYEKINKQNCIEKINEYIKTF